MNELMNLIAKLSDRFKLKIIIRKLVPEDASGNRWELNIFLENPKRVAGDAQVVFIREHDSSILFIKAEQMLREAVPRLENLINDKVNLLQKRETI